MPANTYGLSRFPALVGSSLAVVLRGRIERWHPDTQRWTPLPRTFLMGPQTRPLTTRHGGSLACISLFIHPAALATLAGDDAFQLADSHVDAFDLWGVRGRRLETRLHDAVCADDQALLLFGFVRELTQRQDLSLRLRRAEQLREAVTRSLAGAARDIGITPRQLQRRCVDQLGMTPKRFQRIDRLEHTLRHALATGRSDADLAVCHGYYDQAHMARELRHLVGESLTVLLQHVELPDSAYWPFQLATPRLAMTAVAAD